MQVVEQASIAGLLTPEAIGNAEAAEYLAHRLESLSDPLERGWKGEMVDSSEDAGGKVMEISRTLRGVTERYQLSRRILATEEARRLDEMAPMLQENFARPPKLIANNQDTVINGPVELVDAVFAYGRKGAAGGPL